MSETAPESETDEIEKRYRIEGKTFIWTTDEGTEIRIPLRIKLKIIRSMGDKDIDNVGVMFEMLDQIVPDQADAIDEQDVNDFQAMFLAWQVEYNSVQGASLGESEGSSTSSTSTAELSNTTGEPVSVSPSP